MLNAEPPTLPHRDQRTGNPQRQRTAADAATVRSLDEAVASTLHFRTDGSALKGRKRYPEQATGWHAACKEWGTRADNFVFRCVPCLSACWVVRGRN